MFAEGEQFAELFEEFDGRIKNFKQLYEGMVEAMANSVAHAYLSERGDGFELTPDTKRWWAFWQERAGKLSVVICDLGIGISRSLSDSLK